MAQEHEVRAWVNPSAWDDAAEAERVIDAIMESGSDDEAEWVRLAGGGDDDVAAAEGRDFDRATEARRPGRPTIGPEIKTRVAPELLADIEAAAEAAGLARSAWLRQVIEGALAAKSHA